MKQPTEPFEELFIPRKEFNSNDTIVYRVYSDPKNYELVEAGSALDAISGCSIKKPYKVQRHDPLGDNVIHFANAMSMEHKNSAQPSSKSDVVTQPQSTNEVNDATKTQASTADAPVIPAPAETSAVLSNDDVEKLLNS